MRLVLDVGASANVTLRVVDLSSRAELVVRVLLDGKVAVPTWTRIRNASFEHRRLGSVSRAPATLSNELVVRRGFVDLAHTLLIGAGEVGSLGGAVSEEVAADEGHVGEKFAGLAIGEDEMEESTEMGDGLVAITLELVLVGEWGGTLGGIRALLLRLVERCSEVRAASVPEEGLEELIAVLGGYDLAGGVDDVADVVDEALAFRGEG